MNPLFRWSLVLAWLNFALILLEATCQNVDWSTQTNFSLWSIYHKKIVKVFKMKTSKVSHKHAQTHTYTHKKKILFWYRPKEKTYQKRFLYMSFASTKSRNGVKRKHNRKRVSSNNCFKLQKSPWIPSLPLLLSPSLSLSLSFFLSFSLSHTQSLSHFSDPPLKGKPGPSLGSDRL